MTRKRGQHRPCLEVLEDRLAPAVHTWTGAGGIPNWGIASNWSGFGLPAGDGTDDLVFPAGASQQTTSFDDYPPGTTFRSISFTGGSYQLNGNLLRLGPGGLTAQTASHIIQ